jgi:hypothetical protein
VLVDRALIRALLRLERDVGGGRLSGECQEAGDRECEILTAALIFNIG